MKQRQYRSNQGRSPKKQEEIYSIIKMAFIVFAVSVISCIIIA